MDSVIGKKSANVNLLTLYERKSNIGLAIKIYGKEAKTITKTLRYLQSIDRLIYGVNIKSITTNNGSEFYDWKRFKRSIYNAKYNINVYFSHSYASWEKGGVENFNGLIRKIYQKVLIFLQYRKMKLIMKLKKLMRFIGKL